MKNIAYQTSLFQVRRETNHKEYRELIELLNVIDTILTKSGVEFKFAEYHLSQKLKEKALQTQNTESALTNKEIARYTKYAIQALRCNYLRRELDMSFRECAFIIAASEDFQRFIFAGDFAGAKCPGKSKLHEFASIVPDNFLHEMNDQLFNNFTCENDICTILGIEPLDNKTLWMDATCLMASIHFPVDWVLLTDAVRTLVKSILCIRRHGLKHRIPTPEKFLSEVNSLSMEMANSRRRKDAKKQRKNTLRKIKRLCNLVKKHATNYKDILIHNWQKTDLSEKQKNQIIKRITNVLAKLPQAQQQAHKRIIQEQKLQADEKILSFYDDNAAAIVRGKAGAEVEFGNELFIAEQSDGFIVDWNLYQNKVADQKKFRDFMNRYKPKIGSVKAIVADRGFDGKLNRNILEKHNIYNAICPKYPKDLQEKNRDSNFKKLQKRRSQTEGRVAAAKRFIGQKLKCCDFNKKETHVSWGIFSHNIHLLGKLLQKARIAEIAA